MPLIPALRSLAAPLRRAADRPRKGDATRAAIVDAALAMARRDGLEGLTIGALADALGMSKSGVFAHFGSREELQAAVMTEYQRRFVDEVLKPAVRAPRGLPRLAALLDNWLRLLARELEQGCLMIGGSVEYDDRPGLLHDLMVRIVSGWKGELLRAIELARAEGHVAADIDAEQLVFEIHGLMLALHLDARLLRSRDSVKRARAGLARLLDAVTTRRGRAVATTTRKPAAARKTARKAKPAVPAAAARPARPRAQHDGVTPERQHAHGAPSLHLNQVRSPGRPKTDPLTTPERMHARAAGSRARATTKQE